MSNPSANPYGQPDNQGWGSAGEPWGAQPQPPSSYPSQDGQWSHQGGYADPAGQWSQPGYVSQGGHEQQQAWGQGQQQWGTPYQGSAWADPSWNAHGGHTPQKKKGINPLISVLVAVAVVIAGVGVYALTRSGAGDSEVGGSGAGSKQAQTVEGFFKLLNTQRPSSYEFSKLVTGVGSSGIFEATRNAPTGTYAVVSVGDYADGRIPVKFTHAGKDFDVQMAIIEESGSWKLQQPFASITYRASDNLQFKINETNQTGMRVGRQELHYPGRYTMRPIGGYSTPEPQWEPLKAEYDVLPGETKDIQIQAKLTAKAAESSRKAVIDAFNECLKSDSFSTYNCPFKAQRPSDADYPPNLKWQVSPQNAADQATYEEGGALLKPCYTITADMSYSYASREQGTRQSPATRLKMTGCTSLDGIGTRVAWTSK